MKPFFHSLSYLAATLLAASASLAKAADVVLIDQNKALAGSVSAQDTPGFPVTLLAGNYKLMSNLVVPPGSIGVVMYDSVTLDLNGFSIVGPVICTGSGASRVCPGAGSAMGIQMGGWGATVRNGSVRGFAQHGIYAGGSFANTIESMSVRDNGGAGIYVWGADATITRSIVSGNGAQGIVFHKAPALLSELVVSNNHGSGIETSYGANVDEPIGGGQFRRALLARNGSSGFQASPDLATSAISASNLLGNAYNSLGAIGTTPVRGNLCAGAAC